MSDFDKEAEREKLRKKFARDDEKRASTQRMSELLLKGATMTNKHCQQCSDPLFRYNGQTFCPSCQADGDASAAQTQEPDGDTESDREPPVDTAQAQSVDQAEPQSTQPQMDSIAGSANSPDPQSTGQPSQPNQSTGQPSQPSPSTSRHLASADSTAGLAAARQSLERTITRFVQRAEQTEDPRRARELLTAAHEAASTLSELQR